jgi:predicted Zn-dependent protease
MTRVLFAATALLIYRFTWGAACPEGMANLNGDYNINPYDILTRNHNVQTIVYHNASNTIFVGGHVDIDSILYPFVANTNSSQRYEMSSN